MMPLWLVWVSKLVKSSDLVSNQLLNNSKPLFFVFYCLILHNS